MKRKALIKHWAEIEAFKDGINIQILIDGQWVNTENPKFAHKSKYRIDPKSALEYYRNKPNDLDTSQIDELIQKNESAEDKACRENMLKAQKNANSITYSDNKENIDSKIDWTITQVLLGCEYIIFKSGDFTGFTHKGNCKYCNSNTHKGIL